MARHAVLLYPPASLGVRVMHERHVPAVHRGTALKAGRCCRPSSREPIRLVWAAAPVIRRVATCARQMAAVAPHNEVSTSSTSNSGPVFESSGWRFCGTRCRPAARKPPSELPLEGPRSNVEHTLDCALHTYLIIVKRRVEGIRLGDFPTRRLWVRLLFWTAMDC